MGVFRSFFDRAATEMETIDTGSLATPELRSLAEAANRMVAERDRMNLEKEKMEEQLRQSQKMEAMGSLAGGIAHDFNNILAAIVGYTELAQHQARRGGDPLNELDQVLAASQRARDLVRQILTFSRKSLPELTALDLNREARYAAGILERTIPRMIRVELDLAPDLAPVQGDRTQIEQVLMNLGSNAADAMPGGGRLLIRTDNVTLEPGHEGDLPPGAYARLRVSDDGPGMDQETLERIFDPFFHHQAAGQGHRPGPVHRLWHHRQPRGEASPAGAGPGPAPPSPSCCRPCPGPAGRPRRNPRWTRGGWTAMRGCWWWTTTPRCATWRSAS